MFLARKITRAKWEAKGDLLPSEISADAVTADLRTTGNTLSFWQCGKGSKSELEEIVLAIAASGTRVDKIEVVWISAEELMVDEQEWRATLGRTPIVHLADRHVDVYRLDYVRLGKVANNILCAIKEDRYIRLTRKRVIDLFKSAIDRGQVNPDDLEQKVQDTVYRSPGVAKS